MKRILLTFFYFCTIQAQDVSELLTAISKEQTESVNSTNTKKQDLSEIENSQSFRELDDEMKKYLESLNKNDDNRKFGFDFVKFFPTSVSATADLPVPNNYILSINDQIQIILTGSKKRIFDLQIGLDGSILFPDIGSIQLAGESLESAKDIIKKIVDLSFIGTSVEVSLKALSSKRINIIGAVKKPGTYIVNPYTTISNSLAYAGGLEDYASLRNIELVKSNGKIFEFDAYDLLIHGKRMNDQVVQPGDTIVVNGSTSFTKISGEVLRPMIYEYKPNDTLEEILGFAMGFKQDADLSNIYIKERLGNRYVTAKLNLKTNVGERNVLEIYVGRDIIVANEDIVVRGNAVKEAIIDAKEFKTLDKVIEKLEFSSNIYPFYAQLKQDAGFGLQRENYSFSISDPKSYKDILLKDNVNLRFFSREDVDDMQEIFERILNDTFEISDEETVQNNNNSSKAENRYSEDGLDADIMRKNYEELMSDMQQLREEIIEIRSDPNQYEASKDEIYENLKKKYDDLGFNPNKSNIKIILFGNKKYFTPIAGSMTPSFLFNFFGKNVNILEDKVSVSTKSGLKRNIFSSNLSSDEIIQISFPEQNTISFEVEISGEVLNPGKYLVTNSVTLDDLYRMAGGLANQASENAIFFSRESIKEAERKSVSAARKTILDAIISQIGNPLGNASNQSNTLLPILKLSEDIDFKGRISGDLSPNSQNAKKIYLQKGDSIYVPAVSNSITILGEVLNPTTAVLQDNLTYDDYINVAGKTTNYADYSSAYVIRADGTSMPLNSGYFRKNNFPEAGDTLVIPRDTDKLDLIPLVSVATKVISDVAFAAASINSIRN